MNQKFPCDNVHIDPTSICVRICGMLMSNAFPHFLLYQSKSCISGVGGGGITLLMVENTGYCHGFFIIKNVAKYIKL